MKSFQLKSGTKVDVTQDKVIIERKSNKSSFKGLYANEAIGKMAIKLSAISNIIFDVDYLMLCGLGLPIPEDFRTYNMADIKQYPNCIVGSEGELSQIYELLTDII